MKYKILFLKGPKGTTMRSQWLTFDQGHCPFIISVLPLFFPLAKKKKEQLQEKLLASLYCFTNSTG